MVVAEPFALNCLNVQVLEQRLNFLMIQTHTLSQFPVLREEEQNDSILEV